MTDFVQAAQLDDIRRELARQSALLEQLLALHQQAPVASADAPPAPAPAPKPSLLRRAASWLRGA